MSAKSSRPNYDSVGAAGISASSCNPACARSSSAKTNPRATEVPYSVFSRQDWTAEIKHRWEQSASVLSLDVGLLGADRTSSSGRRPQSPRSVTQLLASEDRPGWGRPRRP